MRAENRKFDQLRPVAIERGIQFHADASVLIKMGRTHVLCGVSVEERVPPFLEGQDKGWITAEYGMLPCATNSRYARETRGKKGRTYEIQRLIGRSLRMMVDLHQIGERTLRVDCDVINADGGTRTAAITGGALAINDALEKLVEQGILDTMPQVTPIAAISAGIIDGTAMLDLDYSEDSRAATDANFVMAQDGRWLEIQATAEETPYEEKTFTQLMSLAKRGINELFTLWQDLPR